MSIIFVPSIELKELQQRGIVDLSNEVNIVGSVKIALARSTFHPDESSAMAVWTLTTVKAAFERIVPTVPNGHIYEAQNAGTTAGSEPTFPIDGGTVLDGSVTWLDTGIAVAPPIAVCAGGHRVTNAMPGSVIAEWQESFAYSVGDFVIPTTSFEDPRRRAAVCIVAGTSAVALFEPAWPGNACDTIVDGGTLTWLMLGDQANLAQHPFISELEITEDVTTVGYTSGGLALATQTLLPVGRSFVLDGDDTNYGGVTTISAAWAVAYLNKIIPDPVSGFWYYPPVGYGLLSSDRSDLTSVSGTFILDWNDAGIMRIR